MSGLDDRPTPEESLRQADDTDQSSMRRWDSAELLSGHREAIIVHGEDEYRLRWTRNNKLILYK